MIGDETDLVTLATAEKIGQKMRTDARLMQLTPTRARDEVNIWQKRLGQCPEFLEIVRTIVAPIASGMAPQRAIQFQGIISALLVQLYGRGFRMAEDLTTEEISTLRNDVNRLKDQLDGRDVIPIRGGM